MDSLTSRATSSLSALRDRAWFERYTTQRLKISDFLSSPYCTSETKRNPEKKSVTKVVDFVEANIVCSCISEKYSILEAIISRFVVSMFPQSQLSQTPFRTFLCYFG